MLSTGVPSRSRAAQYLFDQKLPCDLALMLRQVTDVLSVFVEGQSRLTVSDRRWSGPPR